jgi:hypothetical protein
MKVLYSDFIQKIFYGTDFSTFSYFFCSLGGGTSKTRSYISSEIFLWFLVWLFSCSQGGDVYRILNSSEKEILWVVSADLAHTHTSDGPYG